MLTREQILVATTRRFKDLTIPNDFHVQEFAGQTIRIWSMTAAEEAAMQSVLINHDTGKVRTEKVAEIKARKVLSSVGDEAGKLLFQESDIALILALPASLVDEIASVSDTLNQFQPTNEELEKN